VDSALVGRLVAAMRNRMKITPAPLQNGWFTLAAMVCMTASSGCTSVISSAYLREAWLDAVEHAAETQADAKKNGTLEGNTAQEDDRDVDDSEVAADSSADVATWLPATLDEAVNEADHRLAKSGGLNEAARGALIATLKSTPRQDWPVVIEEFTAALNAAHDDSDRDSVRASGSAAGGAAVAHEREAAPPTAEAVVAEPVAPMPPGQGAAEIPHQAPQAAAAEPAPKAAESAPAPAFAVRNACFASRVRAWGVVDRFETAQFQPEQELIIYFELDQLASRESNEGHTTRIDTVLRLVGEDGRHVHEWTFEPVEETCGSQRRDYFARYLVALPASTPTGPCRLEVAVTDTVAGRTAHASLPLSVGGR
jgi:hypothetical protein